MSDKLMSIVILSWNRLHYTKQTLECLIEKTSIPHEFIFVDNGSVDGTREYLSSMVDKTNAKNVILQFNDKNLGVAGGRNSGLYHASGDYLVTIDDDVLVPDDWDKHLAAACDKIPKLGITGVNVEPIKYSIKEINGIRVRPKKNGNLGGACLCLPRRVFRRVGYYRIFGQYGLEDSDMFVRLNHLGLMSAYIEPKGIHLDEDKDKVYRKVKDRAHIKNSAQLRGFSQAKVEYQKTGNVFVPYIEYDPDDPKWEAERFDDTMKAKADLREIFDKFDKTRGIKLGGIPELMIASPSQMGDRSKTLSVAKEQSLKNIDNSCYIISGGEKRYLTKEDALALKKELDDNNRDYIEKN